MDRVWKRADNFYQFLSDLDCERGPQIGETFTFVLTLKCYLPLLATFQSASMRNQLEILYLIQIKPKNVSQVLSTLSRVTYSLQELRSKELPDGVDARHLESYLSNRDFEGLFEMSKTEYYKLPPWKQIKLRQQKDFF